MASYDISQFLLDRANIKDTITRVVRTNLILGVSLSLNSPSLKPSLITPREIKRRELTRAPY